MTIASSDIQIFLLFRAYCSETDFSQINFMNTTHQFDSRFHLTSSNNFPASAPSYPLLNFPFKAMIWYFKFWHRVASTSNVHIPVLRLTQRYPLTISHLMRFHLKTLHSPSAIKSSLTYSRNHVFKKGTIHIGRRPTLKH